MIASDGSVAFFSIHRQSSCMLPGGNRGTACGYDLKRTICCIILFRFWLSSHFPYLGAQALNAISLH